MDHLGRGARRISAAVAARYGSLARAEVARDRAENATLAFEASRRDNPRP
jgi:hypothetical protein